MLAKIISQKSEYGKCRCKNDLGNKERIQHCVQEFWQSVHHQTNEVVYMSNIVDWRLVSFANNKNIDPRGRPTVTAGSDHYFHKCHPFVCPSPVFKISQNNIGTVYLAEWIIDDTHVLYYLYIAAFPIL